MKKKALSVIACMLLLSCNNPTQKKEDAQKATTTVVSNKTSLWTQDQRENFISKNAKCSFDTMLIQKVIDRYEFEKNDSALQVFLQSPEYGKFIKPLAKKITIYIDDIAGKKPEEVESILGRYSKKEIINPSKVGYCPKRTYLGGLVEIVYIEGKADWITVNNAPSKTKVKDESAYLSLQRFSDYTYIKVKTN